MDTFKPGYGPTYKCDRCKKAKLFAEDRTIWNDWDDGGRINQVCIDCARELDIPWSPQKRVGFIEP